jgi:anti-sigma28 factor (negative regulator of flagellin synthesis)
MPEAMLEIVELESGEVVLRRADSSAGSSEPFVRVSFSEEAKALINGQSAQLGKMMISMGLQAVARAHAEAIKEAIEAGELSEDDSDDDSSVPPNTRLH